jgi:hypothetical protein
MGQTRRLGIILVPIFQRFISIHSTTSLVSFCNKHVRRIDHGKYCLGLQEIAEGESGSVYAARLTDKNIHKLKLTLLIKARDT